MIDGGGQIAGQTGLVDRPMREIGMSKPIGVDDGHSLIGAVDEDPASGAHDMERGIEQGGHGGGEHPARLENSDDVVGEPNHDHHRVLVAVLG